MMLIRIIDDEEEVRDSYKFLLEGEGWLVRTYERAESFIEHDNPKVPGCAIVDTRMDGMNGIDLQNYLRQKNE